jgi:DNA topoisomerase-3
MQSMTTVERKIYDLIRRRFLAQFLGVATFNKTTIEIVCEQERFQATSRVLVSPGWRRAYPDIEEKEAARKKSAEQEERAIALPDIGSQKTSQNISAKVKSTKTAPPKRYTEATLLTAMESVDKEIQDPRLQQVMRNKEKAGIGTDATRSGIMDNLFDRNYLALQKKEIIPTSKGTALIDKLETIDPDLADPVLTAIWEDRLKQVQDGLCTLATFDAEMADWLNKTIAKIKHEAAKPGAQRITPPSTGPKVDCPTCAKPMHRIKGPKGYFWGCTGYKDGCKSTLPDENGKPGQPKQHNSGARAANSGYACPQCEKPLRLVNGANGPFWGCTGYREGCRHTQPDDNGKPGARGTGQPAGNDKLKSAINSARPSTKAAFARRTSR